MTECEEIEILARTLAARPGSVGMRHVDREIAKAMAAGAWNEMRRWHRVRFRLLRHRQHHALDERLGCSAAVSAP